MVFWRVALYSPENRTNRQIALGLARASLPKTKSGKTLPPLSGETLIAGPGLAKDKSWNGPSRAPATEEMDHEQREYAVLCTGIGAFRSFRLAGNGPTDSPTECGKGRGDTQMHQPGSPRISGWRKSGHAAFRCLQGLHGVFRLPTVTQGIFNCRRAEVSAWF
jgi:hypothetical protein